MAIFEFPQQTLFYSGKVRDVYSIAEDWLVMIASNRISAFDVILPKPIPFKGQVLNQIAAYMLAATTDICPNWLVSTPTPNSAIGKKCIPFKVEMVIRGNLTGHAWRTYQSGNRLLCGVTMSDGMKENDFFSTPIITPTTKASVGHDEDISKAAIIEQGIVSEADYTVRRAKIFPRSWCGCCKEREPQRRDQPMRSADLSSGLSFLPIALLFCQRINECIFIKYI